MPAKTHPHRQDLTVVFPDNNGGLRALETSPLRYVRASLYVFLGPSGLGQDHPAAHPCGILHPTRGGCIFIRDQHPKVGMVFQQPNLMPWRTVLDNIKLRWSWKA